ncbi:L-type lectin-domain containing receptor kinase I.8 [Camellia lanceoleosa]|uniref:L-type lectin-domain containing receptor kinase I.8 n=1 Tax=Camellia lanceoleosa TaxID=1840588 RepID=A0ACC0HSX9_9ERIC|nr:L-type lectin-domain containing receptor kinase I.8 [Camellia lanceoleosa]
MALAEDEDQFTYNGFHGANLHLDGVAQVHPNGLLQLTNTSKHQAGHAFYQIPIKFNTSSSSGYRSLSFSTNFVFVMVPEITNLSGHGIAFTISPSMDFTQAVVNQFLGLFNSSNNGLASNHLLAIEFDTIKNLEFDDINDNHVGIDVNGLNSIVSAPGTYYSNSEGINKSLDLISGNPMQAWIDYDEMANLLNVTIAPIKYQKPNRSLLSIHINLSLILLDYMYVGFSSATGAVASNNYILGWSFNKSGQAQSLELAKLPSFPKQRNRKEKSNLEITVSLVMVSIVLIITMLGIFYFVRRKKFEEIHEGDYLGNEMELVLKLGLLCSHSNPATRPSMKQVMQYLDGDTFFPEIILEGAGVDMLVMDNKTSTEFFKSVPSSSGNYSVYSVSSNDSILCNGR